MDDLTLSVFPGDQPVGQHLLWSICSDVHTIWDMLVFIFKPLLTKRCLQVYGQLKAKFTMSTCAVSSYMWCPLPEPLHILMIKMTANPVSISHCYRPDRNLRPIMVQYRFKQNASWQGTDQTICKVWSEFSSFRICLKTYFLLSWLLSWGLISILRDPLFCMNV